jgi:hypothetical protein
MSYKGREDDDRLFDEVFQGDRICGECGDPSYTMFRGKVLCKRCWNDLKTEVNPFVKPCVKCGVMVGQMVMGVYACSKHAQEVREEKRREMGL